MDKLGALKMMFDLIPVHMVDADLLKLKEGSILQPDELQNMTASDVRQFTPKQIKCN